MAAKRSANKPPKRCKPGYKKLKKPKVVKDSRGRRKKVWCVKKKPRKRPPQPAPQPPAIGFLPPAAAVAPPPGNPGPGPAPDPPPPDPGSTDPPPPPPMVAARAYPPGAEAAPADPESGLAVYQGPFGLDEAERLLWRAGFGPRGDDARILAAKGLEAAVLSLTRPTGPEAMSGPEPRTETGPLQPIDAYGHDHLWWLDRMIRTNRPLHERMTLIWHDWFATSNAAVGSQRHMLAQNETFRRHALGNFNTLLTDITKDPAMLLFLNGAVNKAGKPDENYARELMELFSLGADRGAYTETDVREAARALTGWKGDYTPELGWHNFRIAPLLFDSGQKTIFGHTGNFDWRDTCRLCWEHPLHPSFFVHKLWSYFVPTPASSSTAAALEQLYRDSGHEVRPVVEAILMHPDLYRGQKMVKPPVVFCAGLLRSRAMGVTREAWEGLCEQAGQRLFMPPNVSGWNDKTWIDTTRMRARWFIVQEAFKDSYVRATGAYSATESAEDGLRAALSYWNNPAVTRDTWDELVSFGTYCMPSVRATAEESTYRGMRQNSLRQLIAVSPDLQVS